MFLKVLYSGVFIFLLQSLLAQNELPGPKQSSFSLGTSLARYQSRYLNIRYISNRWKVFTLDELHETTEEEQEAKPAKWRFMGEVLIGTPNSSYRLGLSTTVYYTFFASKYLQANALGGLKLMTMPFDLQQDIIPPNFGIMLQINAYVCYPFIEVSLNPQETHLSIGLELRINRVYKKLKRKYDLDLVKEQKWW
ncbi:MAG: hypothetical protein J0M08_11080 [Bacteroidetes bacterium]|nr:hypothetical protein [Bacteroidota bacterium]